MKGANRSFASALRGPVVTITIGVLFLLDSVSSLKFGKTWPILLIVLGAIALAGTGKRYSAGAGYVPEVPYPEEPQYPSQHPSQYPPPYPQGSGVPPASGSGASTPPGVRR
jgi:hypothetical protein